MFFALFYTFSQTNRATITYRHITHRYRLIRTPNRASAVTRPDLDNLTYFGHVCHCWGGGCWTSMSNFMKIGIILLEIPQPMSFANERTNPPTNKKTWVITEPPAGGDKKKTTDRHENAISNPVTRLKVNDMRPLFQHGRLQWSYLYPSRLWRHLLGRRFFFSAAVNEALTHAHWDRKCIHQVLDGRRRRSTAHDLTVTDFVTTWVTVNN